MPLKTSGLSGLQRESSKLSLLTSGAIDRALLLGAVSAGVYALAGADDDAIAVTQYRNDTTDETYGDGFIAVKLLNGEGTFELTTDEASVAVGDILYQAAGGKVSKTRSNGLVFRAVEAVDAGGVDARFNAVLVPDRVKLVSHTVTAAEATANSATIATGIPVEPVVGGVLIDGRNEAGTSVTIESDPVGSVTIAATSLSVDEVITFVASY